MHRPMRRRGTLLGVGILFLVIGCDPGQPDALLGVTEVEDGPAFIYQPCETGFRTTISLYEARHYDELMRNGFDEARREDVVVWGYSQTVSQTPITVAFDQAPEGAEAVRSIEKPLAGKTEYVLAVDAPDTPWHGVVLFKPDELEQQVVVGNPGTFSADEFRTAASELCP